MPKTVTHSALVVYLLLPVILATLVCAQDVPLGSSEDREISLNAATDPLGDLDNFHALHSEHEGIWSKDDGRNTTEKMADILSFSSVLHIDVKLVGFDGDGNFGLRIAEAELLKYFETVLEEHEKHAMVINADPGESHHLPLRRKFFFRVMKAREGLSDEISDRIRSWVLTAAGSNSEDPKFQDAVRDGVQVPVALVDDMIRKDYLETELSGTHTIYLLNPKRVVAGAAEKLTAGRAKDERALFYWYKPSPSKAAPDSEGTVRELPGCGTTMWSGTEQRYMWIDLTAGPLTYGPRTSGEGLVSPFTVPHLNNFMVEGFALPAAAKSPLLAAQRAREDSRQYGSSHHFAFIQDYLAEVSAGGRWASEHGRPK